MSKKDRSLSYIVRVKLKQDVFNNRENTLEIMHWANLVYPTVIGGPNLSYNIIESQDPNRWLFFYFEDRKVLRNFGDEVVKKGFATEVLYGSVKPSFMEEMNPKASRLIRYF